MPVDRSFQLFKELMLQHSVQRPPYSIGLFSLQEFKKVLEWALDTYYRYYKLYQYVFTDRCVCVCDCVCVCVCAMGSKGALLYCKLVITPCEG